MWYLILLILLGLLFLVAELVLLPGISIGALLALICDGSAIYLAFTKMGVTVGSLTLAIILILSLVAIVISLRAKTWQRFSLNQQLDASGIPTPANEVKIGDCGTTLSRLAPMGKVQINNKLYEAKSVDVFIDPKQRVEVIGFENFTVIVKQSN